MLQGNEKVGMYEALNALEQRGPLAQQLFPNKEKEQTEGSVTLFKIKGNLLIRLDEVITEKTNQS